MPWMDGPTRTVTKTHGGIDPIAAICHRTYGSVAGDLAVMQGARDGIGFHLLVGPSTGQWWQGADTNRKCWHAAGANDWSVGIEVTGSNDDPFTDWQVWACGQIVAWLHDVHDIPLVYYDSGREGRRPGFVAHNAVARSDHGDRWADNWDRVVATIEGEVDMSQTVTAVAQRIVMRDDQRGLILDAWGGIHSVGGQSPPQGTAYWGPPSPGADAAWPLSHGPVAVDFAVLSWTGGPDGRPTGWTMDCKGARHPWPGTPPTDGPYWAWSPVISDL